MPFTKGQSGNPGGRPKGPQFKDYVSQEKIDELVDLAIAQAETKPELLKFVLEQIFGKPAQNVNLGGQQDNPIPIINVQSNASNRQDNVNEAEGQGGSGRNICQ